MLSTVTTTPLVLRWMRGSPRTGCERRRTIYIYVALTNNNRVISSGELYCCLLPQCEALRTCRSGFPIAAVEIDLRCIRQIFLDRLTTSLRVGYRLVTSFGHQGWWRVFWEGPIFFKLCPIVCNYAQHIFPGEGEFCGGASPPLRPLVTSLVR